MAKQNNYKGEEQLNADDYMLAPFDEEAERKVITPHSDDAEDAVVGAVFIDPEVYYDVAQFLTAQDFYNKKRQWVWEAFESIVKAKTPIDLLTVTDVLEHRPATLPVYQNLLEEMGGRAYLTELINRVPTSLNAEAYGRIVEADSIRRKIIKKSNDSVTLAYNEQEAIEKVVSDVDAIWKDRPAPSRTTVVTAKTAAERLLTSIKDKKPMAVEAGLENCKLAFGGYPKKAVSMLIGDASSGKTAYLLQECEVVDFKGHVSLFDTLEEPVERMVARRVFTETGISRITWRSNQLTPQDEQKLEAAIQRYIIRHPRLHFDQQARTVGQIERSIRQCNPELVIIDDLRHTRLDGHHGDKFSDTGLLIEVVTRLKDIAIDNDCAMVIIHHMTTEEASQLWPGQNQKKPDRDIPPALDSITWAKDLRYTVDLWLALKPAFDADIATDVVKMIYWLVKDKEGPRLQPIEVYYDKVRQWFYDNKSLPMNIRANYRYPTSVGQMPQAKPKITP